MSGPDDQVGGKTIYNLRDPVDDSDAANKRYVDSYVPTLQTITLSASGWSSNQQTVTVSGISAESDSQLVDVYPVDRDDIMAWGDAKITANQPTTANQITFVCETAPTQDISVAVVMQNM